MSYKILVVEDDNQIQELIVEFLSSQDYDVDVANDGVEGYEKFKENKYDLVILDVMMPRLDGHALCKMIRNLDKEVSIIFLTALGDEESEIKGFDLKADDYISKPFSFNILIKRVEAVLRRKQKEEKEDTILEFEGLKLDLQTFKSYIDNEEIELTLKEFNILKLMINSYPTVVSREKLIEKIWGYEYFGDTRVIDAHMKNIRKKIKKDYIKTIKGVGYVLEK
ncbi:MULTISPECIES: response regulator transcription factor [Clostridium]|mgnify:FL=1|uniref:Stage 0 sporulation protein A homolog n=1 Tax=Clostridium disporicum TaxID=84024 RepID=A0A174CIP7_9CLOT|nr:MULTISPECIES: response regulator transcription factor [Clostridium]MBX9185221.1 response regulator transcription factor [Clostridium sp. K04]MDU3520489.1 response regulator transcription factor [Clostridium saudiense]MDU7455043.1 response regulator transcription factor [Clostridium saudiense]CUN75676.1 two-component system response regulator [Clostridium disporicum]CUO13401.1 two-component system response regulator [Clostridium disporicum]